MPQSKFDETDRRVVVDALSRQSGLQLERVGRRRKCFRDDEARCYRILGGYGEWHGIPEEMMNEEISSNSDGLLMISMRKKSVQRIREAEKLIGALSEEERQDLCGSRRGCIGCRPKCAR